MCAFFSTYKSVFALVFEIFYLPISAQWEIHEKTNNSDFITEYISFTSNDDQGQETDFQWFTFDIYLTERKFLDDF